MFTFEVSLTINRPIEEVFTFVANRDYWPKWASGAVDAAAVSQGRIGVGTMYRTINKAMGRQFEGTEEIIEYELCRQVTFKSASGPMPFVIRNTFERVEGGTKLTQVCESEPAVFFKLATPIVKRGARRQAASDLGSLKDLLEAQAL
jgi:uncharacterized protein YndB with AHSA1/START domain